MFQLKYIIQKLDQSFLKNNQSSYLKTKRTFNKIYIQYSNYINQSQKLANLFLPLNQYFGFYNDTFNDKKLQKQQKPLLLQMFYDQTDTLTTFWKDTFQQAEIASFQYDNFFKKKFYYLKKFFKLILKFNDATKPEQEFMNKDVIKLISQIKILYSSIFSDQSFCKNLIDFQIFQFQSFFQDFFKILELMRPSNRLKTSYLADKLVKKCQEHIANFLNRYPSIKKTGLKIDPETGEGFICL